MEERMNQSAVADLVLSNGAEVNFKVSQDVSGNPVVSYMQISFSRSRDIPQGGISATLLRELTIGELLTLWFQESSRSFLSKRDEQSVWQQLHSGGGPSGRAGLSPIYYACLAYLYVKQCELTPRNPTAEIAQRLQVSPKTISTRLAQARKIGVLSGRKNGSSVTRAGGMLTAEGKKIITTFIKENN
jgi:DNA-binding MarR family transcriptional regulator